MSEMQQNGWRKRHVFITGSADGLGFATASTLLARGHHVLVHVRSRDRLPAVKNLVDKGAVATIADLSDLAQVRDLANQVNHVGRMDAIIHNAGVLSGAQLLAVNVIAPYLLTALIERPARLIYLSSSMHRGGRGSLAGMDWLGRTATGSYGAASCLSPPWPWRWRGAGRLFTPMLSIRAGCRPRWEALVHLTTCTSGI